MTGAATLRKINAAELAEQLGSGSTTVLDVRTPGEDAAASIEGSQHLPRDQIGGHLDVPGHGLAGPVTLVCRSGQHATQAYEQLSAAGAKDLTVRDGGITAWQAAGQPVQSTDGSSTWEMDRQVRPAAGSLVLGGVLASLRWPRARFLSGAVGRWAHLPGPEC